MNEILKEKAERLGFISLGFSRAEKPRFFECYSEWIGSRKYGDMNWIRRHADLRSNPEKILGNCRTVISLAYPYTSEKPCTSDGYTAARYSEPEKATPTFKKKVGVALGHKLHC